MTAPYGWVPTPGGGLMRDYLLEGYIVAQEEAEQHSMEEMHSEMLLDQQVQLLLCLD